MSISENKARISVKVYPYAVRNEIVGLSNGVLCIKISAPPVKGKANWELIAFLSRLVGRNKVSISIVRGHTTRNKVIVIDGLSQEHALELLLPSIEA